MKHTCTPLFWIFLFVQLNAQTCPSANVLLRTQAQVTQFGVDYGSCHDLSNITVEINDDGNDPITSLSALSGLQTFTSGSLRIINTSLASFSGLHNITSIDGSLYVNGNTVIQNMNDFTVLNTVATEIYLGSNTSLEDCQVFCDFRSENNTNPIISIGGNKWGFSCANTNEFNIACGSLPIELSYFESSILDDEVLLAWETLSEIDNLGFVIEKSTNGSDWVAIGWIDGHDTDDKANQYEFFDKAPDYKINYYRIKQIDFDGRFEYSFVVSEYFEKEALLVDVFPNPAHSFVNVRLSNGKEIEKIVLYNTLGQKEAVTVTKNGLYLSNISRGLYVIELIVENENILKRLIVE